MWRARALAARRERWTAARSAAGEAGTRLLRRGEPWFVHRRSSGKLSATPTGLHGWAALIGFMLVEVVAVGLLMQVALRHLPSVAVVPLILVAMTAAMLAFLRWVVIPRGRREDAP